MESARDDPGLAKATAEKAAFPTKGLLITHQLPFSSRQCGGVGRGAGVGLGLGVKVGLGVDVGDGVAVGVRVGVGVGVDV